MREDKLNWFESSGQNYRWKMQFQDKEKGAVTLRFNEPHEIQGFIEHLYRRLNNKPVKHDG